MKPEQSNSSKPAKSPAKESASPPQPKGAAKPSAKDAKEEIPEVPAILLEDDKPSPPSASGPGQRYSLGVPPSPDHVGEPETAAELPESYGTGKLILAARDPHWLYARWDLSREQQRKYNALSADRHLVVRVFLNEIKGNPLDIIHVHPESTHWFIHVNDAGCKYVAELGYYNSAGAWTLISTSGATITPPDKMSDDFEAQFASIPTNIPLPRLLEMARKAVLENIPFNEILAQLKASGHPVPEPDALPGEKWTPERERALASIITMDHVRRVWMGSVEITELIRRQWMHEMSSISAALLSVPGSEVGAISSISSVTSPFGGQERRKSFWFNVNAELIIYGATEPDAEVSIGGKIIRLRQDGTFSYRFILPDGHYELPAVAVSNDRTDSRAAELAFTRTTQFHGDVGHHPQDPAMKPPRVEHVS